MLVAICAANVGFVGFDDPAVRAEQSVRVGERFPLRCAMNYAVLYVTSSSLATGRSRCPCGQTSLGTLRRATCEAGSGANRRASIGVPCRWTLPSKHCFLC